MWSFIKFIKFACLMFKIWPKNPLKEHQEPEGWTRVPVMAQGAKALEETGKKSHVGLWNFSL